MATDRCVLLRPIEYMYDGDSLHYGSSAPGSAYAIDCGTYPSVLVVASNIVQKIGGTLAIEMTSSFHVRIYDTASNNFYLKFDDTTLRDILGFADTELSGANSYTADYTPQYCWVPTFTRSDQNIWRLTMSSAWVGTQTRSGRLVGLTTGTEIYECDMTFPLELASNVFMSAASSDVEKVRCLEYCLRQCVTAYPQYADNVSPAGLYYVHDRDDCIALYTSMDSGGVEFDNADEYVYCFPSENLSIDTNAAIPIGRQRYHVTIKLHTAIAPSWDCDSE